MFSCCLITYMLVANVAPNIGTIVLPKFETRELCERASQEFSVIASTRCIMVRTDQTNN
jgi:hypothetical protein